jgi:hypothetical protein
VVWEDSTAVRRRIRLRVSRDGAKTFDEARSLSTAIKGYASDVTASPAGDVVVVWHGAVSPHQDRGPDASRERRALSAARGDGLAATRLERRA